MGFLGVLAGVLAIATTAMVESSRLDIIDLPTGFAPEGITLADEWTVYVGSFIEGVGSIWKGDLSTGEGEIVVENTGSRAMGMTYDRRSGYLFVCGAFSGMLRIYDTKDYSLVKEFHLPAADTETLVNDVILTDTAAYITESFQRQFYTIPLDEHSGELADGKDTVAVTIPLSSEFTMIDDTNELGIKLLNSNGIEITEDGKTLIIVNMTTGELHAVDPKTGEASKIDLGGALLTGGDGMILRKNTLWVVRNSFLAGDTEQIAEVALSADLNCGSVLPRPQLSEFFDQPATTARKGNSFYTLTGKFLTADEDVATTSYEIVRTDRDGGEVVCSD